VSTGPELTSEQRESIANALYAGQKIAAIKQLRELSGLGLKESKEIIDRLEADLRRAHPEKFTVTRSSGLGCLMVLALLGGAVLLFILLRR
jgi:ribosomal protein L7/L12